MRRQDDMSDLARRSLNAFSDWIVTIDTAAQRVAWCSEDLARALPDWRTGAALTTLLDRYSGLGELLRRASNAASDGAANQTGSGRPAQTRFLTPDGGWLDGDAVALDATRVVVRLTDARERAAAAMRHLTDREQLLSISRSLSVGEMATTLAHELNQPVGAIVNLLRGLQARLQRGAVEPTLTATVLTQAADQAQYAAGIIARMREFVQHRQPRQEPLDLRQIATTTLALLDWEIQRAQVKATLANAAADVLVSGDAVMLQQVVVNLARNAVEAQAATPTADRRLSIDVVREEDQGVLRVSDGGPGLSEAAAARLFTSFFTTKPGGMGIGLNICRSIVELHHGRLWYTGNAWGGCTFHVALPLRAEARASATARPSAQRTDGAAAPAARPGGTASTATLTGAGV